MKLVIDRKQWRRGPQKTDVVVHDPTALLCKDGTKCCLGFYALQCGLPEDSIKGVGEPSDLNFAGKDLPKGMEKLVKSYDDIYLYMDTTLTNSAIEINDGSYDTEAEREQRLTERFAQEGIEVEFHG